MSTEHKSTPLTYLFDKVEAYFKTTSELLKLQAVQRSSESIAGVVSVIVLSILFLHFFIFLNLSIAIWISNWLGSFTQGFLLFGLFYLIVFSLLYWKREEWIIQPIKERIAEETLKNYKDDMDNKESNTQSFTS
jgi:hypothetical protein